MSIDFTSHRQEAEEEFAQKLEAALTAIGLKAVSNVKANLYPGHGLDTGNLRNSIDSEVDGNTVYGAFFG